MDTLVCDTDTVWMKDPMPFFKTNQEADILTSTDVLRQARADQMSTRMGSTLRKLL